MLVGPCPPDSRLRKRSDRPRPDGGKGGNEEVRTPATRRDVRVRVGRRSGHVAESETHVYVESPSEQVKSFVCSRGVAVVSSVRTKG